MSCYEWEQGTIKLPSKTYVSFRKSVIEAHNKWLLRVFAEAEKVHAKVVADANGKRGFDKIRHAQQVAADWGMKTSSGYLGTFTRDELGEEGRALIGSLLLDAKYEDVPDAPDPSKRRVWVTKFRAPKKKDLGLADSKTRSVNLGEASISFDDKKREVTWNVSENNHACEHARAHPVAVEFFRLLGRVEWTRGSGGTIYGNNEYNRESRGEGGGGNFVVEQWPKPKAVESRPMGFGYARRW